MVDEILDDIGKLYNFNFAGFGLRFCAYLIDIIPIIIVLNILIKSLYGINPFESGGRLIEIAGQEFEETKVTRLIVRYVSFLLWISYCAVMESSHFQGTFGKKILGIKVVDEKGKKLRISKSTLRNLTKILSYLGIGLGFIWVLFDKKKRSWHDIISKTLVVRKG